MGDFRHPICVEIYSVLEKLNLSLVSSYLHTGTSSSVSCQDILRLGSFD